MRFKVIGAHMHAARMRKFWCLRMWWLRVLSQKNSSYTNVMNSALVIRSASSMPLPARILVPYISILTWLEVHSSIIGLTTRELAGRLLPQMYVTNLFPLCRLSLHEFSRTKQLTEYFSFESGQIEIRRCGSALWNPVTATNLLKRHTSRFIHVTNCT